MANVIDRDLGWIAIKRNLDLFDGNHVVVGILEGEKNGDGVSIAEYASANEFGTEHIPSRPFMRTTIDENRAGTQVVIGQQYAKVLDGKKDAISALTYIGQWFAEKIQNTITGRDFLPRLSEETERRKKGSTKTLVDTGAMVNSVKASVRGRK